MTKLKAPGRKKLKLPLNAYELMGFQTRIECRPETDSPYPENSGNHRTWLAGWKYADEQINT